MLPPHLTTINNKERLKKKLRVAVFRKELSHFLVSCFNNLRVGFHCISDHFFCLDLVMFFIVIVACFLLYYVCILLY